MSKDTLKLSGYNENGVIVKTNVESFDYTQDHRGDKGEGTSPLGMTLNALAGCHLMTARTYLADTEYKGARLSIELSGDFYNEDQPYFEVESVISVDADLSDEEVQDFLDFLSENCQVSNTLEQGKNKVTKKIVTK